MSICLVSSSSLWDVWALNGDDRDDRKMNAEEPVQYKNMLSMKSEENGVVSE